MTAQSLGQQVANRLNGLGFHPPDDHKMRNVIVDKMTDGFVLAIYWEKKTVFQVGVFHPDIMWKQVLSDLGVE